MGKMSLPEIVRQNMEVTGGEAAALFKIVRKKFPEMEEKRLKASVYSARTNYLKKQGAPGAGDAGKSTSNGSETLSESAMPKPNGKDVSSGLSSFAARYRAALTKISEGEAELRSLLLEADQVEEKVGRFDAAVQALVGK